MDDRCQRKSAHGGTRKPLLLGELADMYSASDVLSKYSERR